MTSLVIDDVKKEVKKVDGPLVAYFYCTRDSSEPRRADSMEVLFSILRQLASSGPDYSADKPLIHSLIGKWQDRLGMDSEHRLDQDECIAVLTEICSIRGCFIIIDALDECPQKHRQNLMDSLDTISQNSTAMVKIFVSSRPNYDIRNHFQKTPMVEILAKSNSQDIENYSTSSFRLP